MILIATIELAGVPKTLNAAYTHWTRKASEIKRWKNAVYYACHKEKIIGIGLRRAHLELTRYSSRECDFDNLVGSFKPIVDGLKYARVIIDDKPSVIGSPIFKWVKVPRKECRIQIKVFDPGESLSPEQ